MQNNSTNPHSDKAKAIYDASGNQINSYIPYYIAKRPWYYDSDSLKSNSHGHKRDLNEVLERQTTEERFKHQKSNPNSEFTPNDEPRKGKGIVEDLEKVDEVKQDNDTKPYKEIKKGKIRCQNCGSTRHDTKDCLEKPLKLKYAYRRQKLKSSQSEEYFIRNDKESWDEKRDRWHGYDAQKDYREQLRNFEQKKRKLKDRYGNEESTNKEEDGLSEDELEEMKELGLVKEDSVDANKDKSVTMIMEHNPLAMEKGSRVPVRSLDDKPRYIEVIKSGGELRFNPKSRVYKDLKEGFLNANGQFVPYLHGEAAKFEKMKEFAHGHQKIQQEKWENGDKNIKSVANIAIAPEASPTAMMLAEKKKSKEDEKIREERKRKLLEKYGAM